MHGVKGVREYSLETSETKIMKEEDTAERAAIIAAMLGTLREAQARHASASIRASEASNEETTRLNDLNNAQKAVDEWYVAQKKDAHYNTDWASAHRREKSQDGT